MRKHFIGLLVCMLVISLLCSTPAIAQEAQPQTDTKTTASDAAGDSSGDSEGALAGESGELSDDDLEALLQALMQEGNSEGAAQGLSPEMTQTEGQSEGTGSEAAESSSDASSVAEYITQSLVDGRRESGIQAVESAEAAEEAEGAESTEPAQGDSAGDSQGASAGELGGSAGTEGGLYGKPWVTSMDAGNLPEEAPEAKDDLILHYTYDTIKACPEGSEYNGMTATEDELKEFMLAYLQDETHDSHEIQQLRIFYGQAADPALKKAGLKELQPYLDMVAGAQSIEELNAVLTSEDFPFSPWIKMYAGAMAQDREEKNHVSFFPAYLYVDPMGEEMLVDSPDFTVQLLRSSFLLQKSMYVTDILAALGVPSEEISAANMAMLNLEKSYGKYCDTQDVKYREYGVYGDSLKTYTLEELEELSANFPLPDILARFGKDKAAGFSTQAPEWVGALNELWNEDNLEILKQMTQAKILMECRNYLDPDLFRVARAALQQPDPDLPEEAYKACDSIDTFGQLIAKTYTEQFLGQETVDRLTNMAQGLINTYKTLVNNTTWLGEGSQQKILDKLNNMKLNILYPEGGYYSYDGLELIPAEEGGTLISNYLKLKEYNNLRDSEFLDQKAQCVAAWHIFSPTMANAFYAEFDNSINIFPGIVTSNVYSNDMTDSEMLGRIGCCIGHEISHAFDFRGSQMDHYGRIGSIFTEEDVDAFLKICDELAAYYDTMEYMPGQFVDGKRVNVEAASDLSGMQVILAYAKSLPEYDLTQLFEGASAVFAAAGPLGTAYTYVQVDNHPLGFLRVNINAQMFDDFYETYGCKEGDGMYLAPENRIRFWGE